VPKYRNLPKVTAAPFNHFMQLPTFTFFFESTSL